MSPFPYINRTKILLAFNNPLLFAGEPVFELNPIIRFQNGKAAANEAGVIPYVHRKICHADTQGGERDPRIYGHVKSYIRPPKKIRRSTPTHMGTEAWWYGGGRDLDSFFDRRHELDYLSQLKGYDKEYHGIIMPNDHAEDSTDSEEEYESYEEPESKKFRKR